jgi:hypothetical protein
MVEQRMTERKEFKQELNVEISNVASAGGTSEARGVDLSSYGLGMISRYPLEQGMVLRISLPIHEIGISLPLFAEVAWAIPAREGMRAGLKFLR